MEFTKPTEDIRFLIGEDKTCPKCIMGEDAVYRKDLPLVTEQPE